MTIQPSEKNHMRATHHFDLSGKYARPKSPLRGIARTWMEIEKFENTEVNRFL